MAIYREDIVKQAESWIGRKESDGSHKFIIDTYNGHKPLARGYKVKYTDAWCATFVSAVAIAQGATAIIPTECGCGQMIELFKSLGCWVETDSYVPSPGDVIFYDWDDNGSGENKGYPEHVGIIQKVSGSALYVIEGNYGDSVKVRRLAVNGKYIRGYGIPKYSKKIEVELTPAKSLVEIAKEVINGKWGNGADRKNKLEAAGYNYKAVQEEVNKQLGAKTSVSTGIKVGDDVIVKRNAKTYDGRRLASFVYRRVHQVKEIKGDRVVITFKGAVTAAVRLSDLTRA